MALGLIGMFDLSIVTDALIAQIDADIGASPLWGGAGAPFPLTVTGSMPEAVRSDGGCQLSLYLFHVSQDPHNLNTPLNRPYYDVPGAALPASSWQIPFLPQALDLHYLLTAYAERSYVEEQQAMSVAMRSIYEHPIVKKTVVLHGQNVENEFTVTMAVETSDELGRLWQAMTSPMRLSAAYKVSVVFLAPESDAAQAAPAVERMTVVAEPDELPLQSLGQLTGTSTAATFELPDGTVKPLDLAPAVAAPGESFVLHGAGLDTATAPRVYLLAPGGPRIEVTPWRTAVSRSSARIDLPAGVGAAPPVGSPVPGVYQLQVGDGVYESNVTPFSVAPRIDGGAPPVLGRGVGGLFTVTGAGFVAGATRVLLGTVPLTEAGAAGPGRFTIGPLQDRIDFDAPAGLSAGRYAVRVRVNEVEAKPAWWVDL